MSPKQVVCVPYSCQYLSHHGETFHPSARHTRTNNWKLFLICSAASQRGGRWEILFVRTADDVEHATSLTTDASIMVDIRMLVLVRSSTAETSSDTSMSLSMRSLHFVLV